MDYIPYNPTPEPESDMPKDNEFIFISVASYRDVECSATVKSIYTNAEKPENIFLGICEQNMKDRIDELCINDKPMKPKLASIIQNNVKYHNMDYTEAKGPTFARYHCSKLWAGQKYYFQIDSHTNFEKNWDTTLIKMLNQCRYHPTITDEFPYGPKGSRRPVLSAYPSTKEQLSMKGFPVMDSCNIDNNLPIFLAGFWDNNATLDAKAPIRSPKPFIAAGFMFMDSDFLYSVQFDPLLSGLFQGEETLFSARMFTNGYDIFAPNIKICSHHYAREGPLYFKDLPKSSDCRNLAEKKVKFLLNLVSKDKVDAEFLRDYLKYSIGNFRPLSDFWKASGIKVEKGELYLESFPDYNFYENGYKKIKQY